MQTVTWPLTAPRRAVFVGTFELLGIDLSAATFDMQVRPAPGDTGTPLIALTDADPGATGINATYSATYLHPVTGAQVGATIVVVQINQGSLQDLPFSPDDPACPLVLAYDLRVTPQYGPRFILAQGTFTLTPGVTI